MIYDRNKQSKLDKFLTTSTDTGLIIVQDLVQT